MHEPLDLGGEVFATLAEVGVHVEAGAGRRKQHRVPGMGGVMRDRDRLAHIVNADRRHHTAQRRVDAVGVPPQRAPAAIHDGAQLR